MKLSSLKKSLPAAFAWRQGREGTRFQAGLSLHKMTGFIRKTDKGIDMQVRIMILSLFLLSLSVLMMMTAYVSTWLKRVFRRRTFLLPPA